MSLAAFASAGMPPGVGAAADRDFTVADDIGVAHFGMNKPAFSPDRKYFVTLVERGRLDLNASESLLLVFRTEDVRRALVNPSAALPGPSWSITRSTYKSGPVISDVRWVENSTGFAFLAKTALGYNQLFLASASAKTKQALTPPEQNVTAYDIRDAKRFVYTVLSSAIHHVKETAKSPVRVGTASTIEDLLFPASTSGDSTGYRDRSELWGTSSGHPFRVLDAASHRPIWLHRQGQDSLALSPDGRLVMTARAVGRVPPEWAELYSPNPPSASSRFRPGYQDAQAAAGQRDVSEYVLVDLASGNATSLTHAPTGVAVGWWGIVRAAWSADGTRVAVSDTFLPADSLDSKKAAGRPCVAVADLRVQKLTCLETIDAKTSDGDDYGTRIVTGLDFASTNNDRIVVHYLRQPEMTAESMTWGRAGNGAWEAAAAAGSLGEDQYALDVSVEQALNDPPVLVARADGRSRVVLNPNPQLKTIKLGEVSVYEWKDTSARDWLGGLYKPTHYVAGKRYPLVIQNHDFSTHDFNPSGSFTTAFAAQALAGVGFLVLQVRDCPVEVNPQEGPCQVAGYEAAVRQLTTDGLVDPDRIGIIGFSRTCFYVMEALTTSTLHFKTASITDGIMASYLQYLSGVDSGQNVLAQEFNAMIGGAPFGEGLQQWFRHSPTFNIEKVTAPLQIVALGRPSLLFMWEPYAAMRYLRKPVDLLLINTDEHVLTNPAARLASQGGSVDWMRFWLQGYEDPDLGKVEQYRRWEQLCDMQIAQNPNEPAFCVRTKTH